MKKYNSQQQLILLMCLSMIGTIGVSLPYPIFAPMLLDSSHSLFLPRSANMHSVILGLVLAMYPLGLFVGSPVLGSMSDIYGRSKLIIYSLLFTTVGYIFTAISIQCHSLSMLLLMRFLTGFAESNIAIIRSAVADMPDMNKHKGFGFISTGLTLGYVIGPPLGGVLSDSHLVSWFNYATPFYAAGFTAFIAAIVSYWQLGTINQPYNKYKALNLHLMIVQFNLIAQLRSVCNTKYMRFLFITTCCFYLGIDIYYEFYPAYLVQQLSMNAFEVALLTSLLSLGMAFSGFCLSGIFARKHLRRLIVIASVFLYLVMLVLTLLITRLSILCLVFSLTGIFIVIASNPLMVQISDSAGAANQGKALGMATGLRMLGDAVISVLGGFLLIIYAGLPLYFAIIITIITLGLVWFILKPGK